MDVAAFIVNHMNVEIHRAQEEDAGRVLALLVQAAEWIAAQGIDQWSHYRSNLEAQEAALRQAIAEGEVYLALLEGRPVATISLLRTQGEWDRHLWGAETGDAIYLHRLTIDRQFAGLGLGGHLLDWAESQAAAEGKRRLRLDCVAANQRLNAYYQKRYQFLGTSAGRGMLFSMYEKALRPLAAAGD